MQKFKYLFVALFTFITVNAIAQKQEKVLNYISQYKELAIAEMQPHPLHWHKVFMSLVQVAANWRWLPTIILELNVNPIGLVNQ